MIGSSTILQLRLFRSIDTLFNPKFTTIFESYFAREYGKEAKPAEDDGGDSCKKRDKMKVKLLKQPVPKLEDTMKMFMISARPLLTQDEFHESCKIVQQFMSCSGDGPKLQRVLEKRAKEKVNWMTEWWLNAAYLENRKPVVIHSSPALVFPGVKFKCKEERINYMARLIRGALEFKQIIDNGKLPQEKRGKLNLDMSQYKKIFGTCRIPGVKKDSIKYNTEGEHIVVIYKNHFFKMPVFDKCGMDLLNEDQLTCQLELILQMDTVGEPVGILTTDNRDNWGKAFKLLMAEKHNKKVFEYIESALFVLCIDGTMPKGDSMNQQSIAARQLLHGGGSKYNSANRWFDKTIQFVVGEEGQNGIIFEHSPIEAGPVAMLCDYVIAYIRKGVKAKPCCQYKKACHIAFSVESELQGPLSTAKRNLDCAVQDLQVYGYTFKQFGSNFVKKQKLSPDAFIQMAFQLAFYRIHNKPAPQYESAALRIFEDARTENIRGCSIESVKMARTLLNRRICGEERNKILQEAIKAHRAYTMKAIQGLGCDRHLFGLKMAAKEKDMVQPRIFVDAAYVKSSHWRMSTSQVSTKCDAFMIYGPAVRNGYGCCYNPRADSMNFGITAFASYPGTVPEKFRVALEESFMEMKEIIEPKKQPPKAAEPPKKPEPKKEECKKEEPKKEEPKKDECKKEEPKKEEPKKDDCKKEEPKKDDCKKDDCNKDDCKKEEPKAFECKEKAEEKKEEKIDDSCIL